MMQVLLILAVILGRMQYHDCFQRQRLPSSSWIRHDSTLKRLLPLQSSNLENWLREQGCKIEDNKLTLRTEQGKAVAQSAIKEGDTLLSIPVGLSLDSSKVPSKLSQAIDFSYLQTKELGKLALLLLYERSLGKDSRYAVYIQSLPDRAPGVLSWGEVEIKELLQSSTRNYAILFDAIENDLLYLSSCSIDFLFKEGNTGLAKDFRWAIGIVKSRRVRVDEKWSLLPGIDCLPFDPFAENEPTVSSTGLFGGKTIKVTSDRNYEKNNEVYISYGIKSSAQCLEDHGILPSSTEAADLTCEINVDIDEGKDKYPDDKIGILEENGLRSSMSFDLYGDITLSGSSGGIDNELLRFLRLKLITGKDCFILEACFSNSVFATMALPFSRNNEIDVTNYLLQFCQNKLSVMNAVSSQEADNKLVKELKDSSPKVLMAKLRTQERQVLQANLDYLKAQLESLQGPADFREYYQERRLKELDLLRPLDESEIIPID